VTLIVSVFAAAFLSGITVCAIALIVVGIKRDDRSKSLTHHPHTHIEAATRRMLGVGVRDDREGDA
jgi:hypothetical protein